MSSTVSRVSKPTSSPRVHGVAAELYDGHLHALPGPVGRFLKDQCGAESGQRSTEFLDRRRAQRENFTEFADIEIRDVEEVAKCHDSNRRSTAMTSSISERATFNGGANLRAVGVTAFVTTPCSRSC